MKRRGFLRALVGAPAVAVVPELPAEAKKVAAPLPSLDDGLWSTGQSPTGTTLAWLDDHSDADYDDDYDD